MSLIQHSTFAEQIMVALRSVLRTGSFVPLHEPCFCGSEWRYVKDCLDTGWVSSVGRYVDQFEASIAEFTGVRHAVATVNGTSALHIALKVAGVERGDEVLMPALTFVATANAVSYCRAMPHFVDSEERTLGVDPEKLRNYLRDNFQIKDGECFNKESGRRLKAMVVVHTFGHPADMEPLADLCKYYRIELIEDAAEALGSYYHETHVGHWGHLSILSFNGNKTITTGGGGAVLTNDEAIGRKVKHLTTTAKTPHPWEYRHDEVGYNYRLPNINAALGCAQLEKLPIFLRQKRALAECYEKAFNDIEGITFFKEADFARSNYWLNTLILSANMAEYRDELLQTTNKEGVMTRPAWRLMHRLPMYESCPRMDLAVSESLERRLVNIPSGPALGEPYV